LVTLADLVAEQHDRLIERFAERARQEAGTLGLERVELVDSLPYFLDDLVDVLASGVPLLPEESAAASHGVERLAIGFRVDRVVREYLLIAELIMEVAVTHDIVPTMFELTALLRAVGDGAAIAASEHVRRREADLMQREAEHAGFLAHDVRNSIASARFAFELLRRRDFADPRSLVDIIDGGLRQAGARIDDVLAGARVRGGAVSWVRVFPRLLLDEIAAALHPQADARQIAIVVEGASNLNGHADARLLRSALENLASNAVKFSCSGGTVTMRATARAHFLEFEIGDSCGGIDEGMIDRLFRPFMQGGEDRSGFGLGLALARECAEAQGGHLRVTNNPGHGCVFTLSIPIER
jgi:signal transduction histidine kinase